MRNIEARADRRSVCERDHLHPRTLVAAALVLVVAGAFGVRPAAGEKGPGKDGTGGGTQGKTTTDVATALSASQGVYCSPEKREEYTEQLLANPLLANRGPHLRVIRMTLGESRGSRGKQTTATAILFDHQSGKSRRVAFDVGTNAILQDVELPGRPQSSRDEFEEAAAIVRADDLLAGLLKNGGVLDGGFIVADPSGGHRRLMQLKLLTADRRRLMKAITVDLTNGVITSTEKEEEQKDPNLIDPKPVDGGR
jgi:hypothetical protein